MEDHGRQLGLQEDNGSAHSVEKLATHTLHRAEIHLRSKSQQKARLSALTSLYEQGSLKSTDGL